ncbi:MAG: gliding motility protein GldN [Chitinophagales bacterium]|nr:gliding motility protein GldN [Chitinophagales bacterium]
MKPTIRLITVMLICCCNMLPAQQKEIEENVWIRQDRNNMQPLEYEYQREADVMWSKNVWRIIDVRQKLNLPFAYPQQPLIQIIHQAAKKGEITVYDPTVADADKCKKAITREEVERLGVRNDTDWVMNVFNADIQEQVVISNELTWDKIVKYRIKEVWFFDTKTSTMKVRIIAIAPVMEDYDASGNYRGDMTMYWIPYASLRNLFAKHEVFEAHNNSQRYSWDDLFEMRKFQSYIYKESNVFDRSIQEYTAGVDAHLESERIKQQIFEKEHDMWNY